MAVTALLLLLTLTIAWDAAASSATLQSASPSAVLKNQPLQINLVGRHLQGLTALNLSADIACLPPVTGWNVTGTPCLLQQSRDAVCARIGSYLAHNLIRACSTSEYCIMDESPFPTCPTGVSDDYTCSRIRCFYSYPINKCVEYPYSLTDFSSFNGTACSATPNYACSGGRCVDAFDPDCDMHTTCTLPAVAQPGDYNLTATVAAYANTSAAVSSIPFYILDWPIAVGITTSARTWDLQVPVGLSPGTPFAIDYTFDALAVANASIAIAAANTSLAGGIPPLPYTDATPLLITLQITYHDFADLTYALPYAIPILYLPVPAVYSICPFTVLSLVNSTLVVEGAQFANTTQLECLLDGASVPIAFLNAHAVACTVYPLNFTDSTMHVTVSNDGVSAAAFSAALQVQGSCETRKPFSAVHGNACQCLPGYYDDAGICTECPNGSYQPDYGQAICVPCDSSEDTGGTVRNTAASACECRDGRYRASPSESTCTVCAAGMLCEDGTVTVLPGYWRASPSTFIVVHCEFNQQACAGGSGGGDSLCHAGYHGPLCATCAAGFGEVGNNCIPCGNDGLNWFVVLAMLAGVSLMLYLIIKGTTAYTDKYDTTSAVIKITWSYVQLLFYIGRISADWSDNATSFFQSIVPASFSPSFLFVQCASQFSFYQRIAVTMLSPVIVSAALLLFFVGVGVVRVVVQRFPLDVALKRGQLAFRMSLLITLYLLHPTIALDVISSLRCVSVAGTGDSFVQTDLTVSCSSESYSAFRIVAALYIVLYIFGGMAAVTIAVRNNELEIRQASHGAMHDNGLRYVYFIRGYSDKDYLFELAVMGRKLSIVICSALLSVGLQLVYASIVIGVSLAYTVTNRPYSSVLVNRLDSIALCALLTTLILGFHSLFLKSSAANTPIFVILVFVNLLVVVGLLAIAVSKVQKKVRIAVNKLLAAIDERMNISDDISDIQMHSRESTRDRAATVDPYTDNASALPPQQQPQYVPPAARKLPPVPLARPPLGEFDMVNL